MRNLNNNLVIITAYVETPPKRKRLEQRSSHTKKSNKSNPLAKTSQTSTTTGPHGYNRRAQLLAYARKLRDSGTEQAPSLWKTSNPKFKERSGSSPERSRMLSCLNLFQRQEKHHEWRYQRIPTVKIGETVHLCGMKCVNKKRSNSHHHGSKISYFCGQLKRILREQSCGLQCNKVDG